MPMDYLPVPFLAPEDRCDAKNQRTGFLATSQGDPRSLDLNDSGKIGRLVHGDPIELLGFSVAVWRRDSVQGCSDLFPSTNSRSEGVRKAHIVPMGEPLLLRR